MIAVAVAALVLGAAVGFASTLVERGAGAPPAVVAGVSLLVMAVLFALALVYWRQLDEAAREAHKWAWYWGGSGALLLVMAAIPVLLAMDPDVRLPAYGGREDPAGWVLTGLIGCFLAQMLGYGVAWIVWWLRKR